MGKDMQRALLWAILFTSCFLLWDNYQVYKGEKSFFHTEAVEQQAVADAASSVPTGKDIDATVPSAVAVKDPVVVETDRMKVTFDREGAVIVGDQIFVGQGGGSGIIVAGKAAKQENVSNFFETLVIRLIVDDTFKFCFGEIPAIFLDLFEFVVTEWVFGHLSVFETHGRDALENPHQFFG